MTRIALALGAAALALATTACLPDAGRPPAPVPAPACAQGR